MGDLKDGTIFFSIMANWLALPVLRLNQSAETAICTFPLVNLNIQLAIRSMSASYQCIASSLRLRLQGDGGGDFRAGTNHQRQRARPQHRPPATVRRSMLERRSSYKTGSSSNFSPPR